MCLTCAWSFSFFLGGGLPALVFILFWLGYIVAVISGMLVVTWGCVARAGSVENMESARRVFGMGGKPDKKSKYYGLGLGVHLFGCPASLDRGLTDSTLCFLLGRFSIMANLLEMPTSPTPPNATIVIPPRLVHPLSSSSSTISSSTLLPLLPAVPSAS